MSRFISTIPQKPRSNRFKYYDTGNSTGGGGGGGVIVQESPEGKQEIAYIDTYDNIPNPPENGLKLVITQDTNQIYTWDDDNQEWVNTTPQSGVTKIIQGENVSITPQSGVGEVTINSTGGGGGGGGSQSANTVGYYTVSVASGTRLQDTTATAISITTGLPTGQTIIGATYLIPSAWTFPVVMELSTNLTTAYLYCTLENDRNTPQVSYILVQYQKSITFGTNIQAGTNVTITGDGSQATPYTVNATSPSLTRATDTTSNLDLLTDATAMSGNTIQTRYKTLTQGTNMSITQNSSQIVLNATGGGGGGVSKIIAGTNVTISPTTGLGDVTINSTGGGGGITLQTNGSGNSVSQLSLSGSTLTQNMGYKLNSVTESSDTSTGFFYVCANNAPQYSNGVLNLPYKQLIAGQGINIENGTVYPNNVIISATGGGGGGNIQDVTTGLTGTIKIFRYEYVVKTDISVNPQSIIGIDSFTAASCNMTSIFNAFPSILYPSNFAQNYSFYFIPLLNTVGNPFTNVVISLYNFNSNQSVLLKDTEINILLFGQ